MAENEEHISTFLYKARVELGVTQAAMAELLEVAPNTYARWERDDLTPMRQKSLKVLVNDLLTKKDAIKKLQERVVKEGEKVQKEKGGWVKGCPRTKPTGGKRRK